MMVLTFHEKNHHPNNIKKNSSALRYSSYVKKYNKCTLLGYFIFGKLWSKQIFTSLKYLTEWNVWRLWILNCEINTIIEKNIKVSLKEEMVNDMFNAFAIHLQQKKCIQKE